MNSRSCIEVAHRPQDAAAEGPALDDLNPDLDESHPRGVGRRERNDAPRMLRQPGAHIPMLVGGVVVSSEVQLDLTPILSNVAIGPIDQLM
jgi:hypothetical protein